VSERTLRRGVVAFALAGIALTAYLLYIRESGSSLACPTGGCETVQTSSYSAVLGVPVALLGLLGYIAIVALALARGELARLGQATLALAALAFAAYLLYVQLHVLDAVCAWCVGNDVLVAIVAGLSVASLLRSNPATTRPARPAVLARARGARARPWS
jgi:uncharacterized membrane protein